MSNATEWLGRNLSLGGLLRHAGSGIGTVTRYGIKGAGAVATLFVEDLEDKQKIRSACDTAGEFADTALTRGSVVAGEVVNVGVRKASVGVGYAAEGAARAIGMSEENVEFARKLGTAVGAAGIGAVVGGGIGDAAVAMGALAAGTAGGAATTAGLAALGGGSLAAGGSGMAGGISALQGIAAIGGASGLTTLAARDEDSGDSRFYAQPLTPESQTIRRPSQNMAAARSATAQPYHRANAPPIFLPADRVEPGMQLRSMGVRSVINDHRLRVIGYEDYSSRTKKARARMTIVLLIALAALGCFLLLLNVRQPISDPLLISAEITKSNPEDTRTYQFPEQDGSRAIDSTAVTSAAPPTIDNTAVTSAVPPTDRGRINKSEGRLNQKKVRRVQTFLKRLGYSPGTIDGVQGKRTAEAIMEFERYHGWPPTGEATESLLEALETRWEQISGYGRGE